MSTEEIKMIVDLLSNATNGAKDVVMVMLGLEFTRMLLTLIGVLGGIIIIIRQIRKVVIWYNSLGAVQNVIEKHIPYPNDYDSWNFERPTDLVRLAKALDKRLTEVK